MRRNGTVVLSMVMDGSLSSSSAGITIPAGYSAIETLANADIDTGTWVMRIEKASDAAVYMEGSVGAANGSADFWLSEDLDESGIVAISPALVLRSPALDTVSIDVVTTLINDMKLFHDGPVRTLQWIPQWGTGRNYPETYPKPQGWQIGQPWGVITADTNDSAGSGSPWRVPGPYTGNRAPNTRAQVRDLQLWWLMSNGQWVLGGHDPKPAGEMYHASWAGDAYTAENAFRDETGNGGGVSARYINMNAPGTSSYQFDQYLWHFYGSRASVPSGYVGLAIAYFARKILHDPSGPDDRANARLLADTAGDWWTTADARWDNFKTNGPMGYNRFKYLTNDWQMISFHTLTEAQITANPPPFIGV